MLLANVRYLIVASLLTTISAQSWSTWEEPDYTVTRYVTKRTTVCPCATTISSRSTTSTTSSSTKTSGTLTTPATSSSTTNISSTSTTTSSTTTTVSSSSTITPPTTTTTSPQAASDIQCSVMGASYPAGSKQLSDNLSETAWTIDTCASYCRGITGSKSFAFAQALTDANEPALYDCVCISTSVADSGVSIGTGSITYADLDCVTPPPVSTTTTTAAPNPTFSLTSSGSSQVNDGTALQVTPRNFVVVPESDPSFTGLASTFVLNAAGNLVDLATGQLAMGAYPPTGAPLKVTFDPASEADDVDYVPCVCTANEFLTCQCADKDRFATDSSGALYVYENSIRNNLPSGITGVDLRVNRVPL